MNKQSVRKADKAHLNPVGVSRKVYERAGCVTKPISEFYDGLKTTTFHKLLTFKSHFRSDRLQVLMQCHEEKGVLEILAPSLKQQSGNGNSKASTDQLGLIIQLRI